MNACLQLALNELRTYRSELDSAIAQLEGLVGEPSTIVQGVLEPAPEPQRALPPKPRTPRVVSQQAGGRVDAVNDLLRAVQTLGANASKQRIQAETGLSGVELKRVKDRLIADGRIVVTGHARAARWSLVATKEAPQRAR